MAVVVWLAVIMVMTHTPPDSSLMRGLPNCPYGDKLVHTGLYGLLGWLLWYKRPARGWEFLLGLLLAAGDELVHTGLYGLLGWLLWYKRPARGWEFLLGLLLAAGDELTQPWVGRMAELGDWLADAFGLTAGLGLASLPFRWRQHGEKVCFPSCRSDVRETASAGAQEASEIGWIGEPSEQPLHRGNHASGHKSGWMVEQLEGTDLPRKDWPDQRGSP